MTTGKQPNVGIILHAFIRRDTVADRNTIWVRVYFTTRLYIENAMKLEYRRNNGFIVKIRFTE